MKKFFWSLLGIVTACSIHAAPVISWNSQNNFKGWHMPYRCEMKISNSTLKLDITGHDSSIRNNSVQIPTDKYDAIEIDYRAEGLPAVNNGEIYYAGEGKYDSFTQSRAWTFQNIPGNTDWYTLRVTPGGKGGQAWLDTKLVTKIRLDLFNQFPGKVEIREIRIMPKLRLDLVNNAPGKIEIREIRFTKSAN